ncbi:hypothetical protein FO519_003464 [Halicephalobus sp. NKZ332]|nr:hypothetical protein FO519_003464 [Halicephalobus sp. NKZ332]
MISKIFVFLGLAFVVYGCNGPLSGPLITNPSFSFQFSPPLGWTFTTNTTYPGQQSSSTFAQQRMNNDVTAGILLAAQKLGINTMGWRWTLNGYSPTTPINVVDSTNTTGALPGTYVPGLGAVLQLRGGAAGAITYTDYILDLTIRVTSNNGAYFQSQWQSFADQVFSILSIQYNVKFRSAVTIS